MTDPGAMPSVDKVRLGAQPLLDLPYVIFVLYSLDDGTWRPKPANLNEVLRGAGADNWY